MLQKDVKYAKIGTNLIKNKEFHMNVKETSFEWAKAALPKRSQDANKGSYGRLFIYAGSEKYPGAAHLALESALRGGVGYVEFGASGELKSSLLAKFPETIFKDFPSADRLSEEDILRIREEQRRATATLIGCGSGVSLGLAKITLSLLSEDGGALVIDADAINSLALVRDEACAAIREAVRPVILTPHPLEFSRLSGVDVSYINYNRVETAEDFSKKHGCVLVLKGHGTVITDGEETYLNTSGSSALAKAGSGDTLAGLMAALLATKVLPPKTVAALACYIHGRAGDNMAQLYSEYGVTPSDLPKEMAKIMREFENE